MSQNSRNFVQAVLAFDAVVQRVDPSAWGNATPCEGWDARDLVEHQCTVLNGVSAIAETGEMASPTPPADMSDPTATWNETRDRVIAAIDRQGVLAQEGPFWFRTPTVDDLIGTVMWDAVAHTWDLATAVGEKPGLDDALVQASYDVVAPLSNMMVESGRTAAPIEVPDDAPILTRYLALVGRRA